MGRLVAAVVAVVACGALIASAPGARADDAGALEVLAYNIAGLPEILSSATTPREAATTEIGRRIGDYDVVHVEEDFNYHAALYTGDSHPYRTPTSGGVPFGSGLNTVARLPYDTDDFQRVKWDDCSIGSGDCLTPKGFTFARHRLADGVYLDLYNLHTDAGDEAGDIRGRAANLTQLSAFIATHSAGNAVIVMGDTNTRYTRTGDTIARFAADNGFTDAWVELARGGSAPAAGSPALLCDPAAITDSCEVVDKILYRGSTLVNLHATAYHNEHAAFLDANGTMLSDHDPIHVSFAWSRNPGYRFSEQFGGPHGDYFNDIDRVPPTAHPTRVVLRGGSRLDQISLALDTGATLTHGGTGGTETSLSLSAGEYLASAGLCRGVKDGHTRVFSAKFTTSTGRTLSAGSATGDCVTYTAPDGWQITGLHGRSGDEIDKVGFIYTKR
ncbi:jacalin-like lectin [Nocardia inohanensis]|uniref:jacalin-like lectin n=1 Tax=Nocardia inohanensis TaxID=209246 RepID=UPI00082EEF01|nr:jacalin-like lectin [Nocardia inohanensis]